MNVEASSIHHQPAKINPPTTLITGGASGLGRALAMLLAQRNADVIIVDKDAKAIHTIQDEFSKNGKTAKGFDADVTDEKALTNISQVLHDDSVVLDYLILCAGDTHVSLLADFPNVNELRKDLETDLWGVILSCRLFAPFLSQGSKIILISSGFGIVGTAGYSVYAAAKAGVINFADALRRELKYKSINVYAVCPGDMDTPLFKRELSQQPQWMQKGSARITLLSPEKAAQRILKKCRGDRSLILISFEVYLVYLMKKFLPEQVRNFIIDRMFPMPGRS